MEKRIVRNQSVELNDYIQQENNQSPIQPTTKQATTVTARNLVTNTLPTLSMPLRSDSEPHSVSQQGKQQKQVLLKCVVTPPQISTSHRESPEVCYQQAHAQQSPANRNHNTQPREQKHQIEEHDLSSRPALPQRLTIVPESSHVNHPLLPTSTNSESSSQTPQTPPRNSRQSGPPSSSSSTTSPQRKPTTVQPVSNNCHVQLTNPLDPLDINVSDSKLNAELPSQETQAKDKVRRDSQQEPWSPQEELKVVQPSTKENKPETLRNISNTSNSMYHMENNRKTAHVSDIKLYYADSNRKEYGGGFSSQEIPEEPKTPSAS
ncbi:cyclin-dependent kinase 12-like [Teleopsis dalmanni]|uniref:cyclin-dependent kinase 12-like n=1 Tax=Teleopsis dalmanni TaxID=139649 RepID=UPI0018CFA770|nr:cyclin-dependent kinase 12-like [Teleopsis dalmanni]XP_037930485.1 cyclin-dependent kinase 12-like [Teleopsis dalmanni]